MNKQWDNLFGQPPASFEGRVRRTVRQMASAKPERLRIKPLAAVLACTLLLGGTALALNGLGVLDTLSQELRGFLQPKATEMVQTAVEQTATQPKHATFTVEQAINDGHQTYALIRVHADADTLLMDHSAEPFLGVAHWKGGEYQQASPTFSERADELGRNLVQATLEANDASGAQLSISNAEIAYDGEDILYTVSYPAAQDAYIRTATYDVFGEDKPDSERLSFGEIKLSVPVTDERSYYLSSAPVTFHHPTGDIVLTKLTVEQTPVATYVTYEYGAADKSDLRAIVGLNDGIWPLWLDENGEEYRAGDNAQALNTDEDGNTSITVTYRAFETLPEQMTIRMHSGMSKGGDADAVVSLIPAQAKEETK